MRLAKLRAVIQPGGIVQIFIPSNGATPEYVGLLHDLTRIDTCVGQFQLITKSGDSVWVDEIQNGGNERSER